MLINFFWGEARASLLAAAEFYALQKIPAQGWGWEHCWEGLSTADY